MNINLKNVMKNYIASVPQLSSESIRFQIETEKEKLSAHNQWHEARLKEGMPRSSAEYDKSIEQMKSYREMIRNLEHDLTIAEQVEAFNRVSEPLRKALEEAEGRATARTLTAAKICEILRGIEERCPTKKALEGTVVRYDGGEHFPSAYKYTPESTHFTAEYKRGSWRITDIHRGVCPNRLSSGTIEFSEAAEDAILNELSKI